MGEIADMMLDGTLCQSCGEYLEGSLGDFPQTCGGCQSTEGSGLAPRLPLTKNGQKKWRQRHRGELLHAVGRFGRDPSEENAEILQHEALRYWKCGRNEDGSEIERR